MHTEPPDDRSEAPGGVGDGPWHRGLTRYHWFVLGVAALGWLFDTMDQQLFNLARKPAMQELLEKSSSAADQNFYGGLATSIFIVGWAVGGLFFGVLGDRIGRAKTMVLTILVYSAFTGLSALSVGVWDFAFYRFLTGLGVGGEFAVGVALVAEVMPDHARARALGWLQALSAVGNMMAAVISVALGFLTAQLTELGVSPWRVMFVVGTLPALLALVIRARLKEPERWQKAATTGDDPDADSTAGPKLGSIRELFTDPRWRRNTIVGMMLALAGVIGLWGIGFFSFDLITDVFSDEALQMAVDDGEAVEANAEFDRRLADGTVRIVDDPGLADQDPDDGIDVIVAASDDLARKKFLKQHPTVKPFIDSRMNKWRGYVSFLQNGGAFFGIYAFSVVTGVIGRRASFLISFLLAMTATALTFLFLGRVTGFWDVYWMIPIMGFCQLSLFGGYAIYFPELFPTRLRSTGTSFCYNVGRLIAALGPALLGLLNKAYEGYAVIDTSLPMRYAGVTMCLAFLIGLAALPFAPETKGQPLPE